MNTEKGIEAIEKFLEAEQKGLNTAPFVWKGDQIVLRVVDKDEEVSWETVVKVKRDFKDPTKVYSYEDIFRFDWTGALLNVSQKAIDQDRNEKEKRDKLIFDLLQSLEK
jgi:hypothetical protein